MSKISLQDCQALDDQDPLAHFREQFHIPADLVYMDGNSLGMMPKTTQARIQNVLQQQWGDDLIGSWNKHDWFEMPYLIGDKIAKIIGAAAGEVVVSDSVSINVFKLLSAALSIQNDAKRVVILSERGNFPTDLYMIQGLCSMLDNPIELVTVEREQIIDALSESTAVLLLTDVNYKTGHLHDKEVITKAAQGKGALVIWDLCHSAGALPVNVTRINADMAVGCGYKYLNGGPGAPAFSYVAKRWHSQLQQPLSGWWAHARPFAFEAEFDAAPGIGKMLCGTQSVLAMAALDEAVDLFLTADMQQIREKSMKLGDLFIELLDSMELNAEFVMQSPLDAEQRGSQISLGHEHAHAIMQALIAHKVVGDFRAPNTLRFGLTPLTLRYADVWTALSQLKQIMREELWRQPQYQAKSTVT